MVFTKVLLTVLFLSFRCSKIFGMSFPLFREHISLAIIYGRFDNNKLIFSHLRMAWFPLQSGRTFSLGLGCSIKRPFLSALHCATSVRTPWFLIRNLLPFVLCISKGKVWVFSGSSRFVNVSWHGILWFILLGVHSTYEWVLYVCVCVCNIGNSAIRKARDKLMYLTNWKLLCKIYLKNSCKLIIEEMPAQLKNGLFMAQASHSRRNITGKIVTYYIIYPSHN